MGLVGTKISKMPEVYIGKNYGVKRIKDYFVVEEVDILGDISKYDFFLKRPVHHEEIFFRLKELNVKFDNSFRIILKTKRSVIQKSFRN